MEQYNGIEKALNVETEIIKKSEIFSIEKISTSEDMERDYSYSRSQLYSLIEKGQEAVNGIWMLLQVQIIQEPMKLLDN